MKVLPFTIPVSYDKTVIIKTELLPHFYPYFHRHEEIQITFIQRGEGTLLVGNNMYPFSPNEIYILGANMPHVFKSDPTYFSGKESKNIQSVNLFFSPKGKLSTLFELPELKNIQYFLSNFTSFRVPQISVEDISGMIMSIKYSSGLEQLLQFFQLLKALSDLEDIITLSPDIKEKSYSDFEGIRMSRIYGYIMEHYQRDITLEEVAAAAYMTPQAFCRYFKKHTQSTFISFLNQVRINEARKKLLDGSYGSISSVAYDCGFNSITNFNRVFKTTTGKSPREYLSEFINKAS